MSYEQLLIINCSRLKARCSKQKNYEKDIDPHITSPLLM